MKTYFNFFVFLGSNSITDSFAGLLQKFSYESILNGTSNFGDNYFIGSGAFAKVYRGTIKKTTFAIKVFNEVISALYLIFELGLEN